MKKIEKIKEWIGLLTNYPYIPEELREAKGPLLLHISDTPEEIYKYIIELVKALDPAYIVHTGDLVDNIKLEILPEEIENYKKSLKHFISSIEECSRGEIYYVMGNHDKIEVVKNISQRGIVMVEGHIIIEGLNFYVKHYHVEKLIKAKYHLFGHSFTPRSYSIEEQVGLNGIEGINVIDLATETIYILPYPLDTNLGRKMEPRRIGL